MYIMASIVHLGKSGLPKTAITEDDLDRLSLCIRLLADQCPFAATIYLDNCRQSLDMMLQVCAAHCIDSVTCLSTVRNRRAVNIFSDVAISVRL